MLYVAIQTKVDMVVFFKIICYISYIVYEGAISYIVYEGARTMADISLGGGSVPSHPAASVRPPERVESERREAVDSDIERGEAERSENALQNKSEQAAQAEARTEQRSQADASSGRNVDVQV